jgi:hypothetical protein
MDYLSSRRLSEMADELLAAAPLPRVVRLSPARFSFAAPAPRSKPIPANPAMRRQPAIMPHMTQEDYDAINDLLEWSQEYAYFTQDPMHTTSWSWSPLEGLWYVWTTNAEGESKTLAEAVRYVLSVVKQ